MDIRLKKQSDFDLVFKRGKRLFSESLTLIYIASKQTKVGFAVSKGNGKSVQRNRVKRLLREAFRSLYQVKTENFFFVFIPKKRSEYSYEVFKRDMQYLLNKVK